MEMQPRLILANGERADDAVCLGILFVCYILSLIFCSTHLSLLDPDAVICCRSIVVNVIPVVVC